MKTWKSTGKTTRTDADRFVINLLREGKEPSKQTLKQYVDPFFDYERCPHIRRLLDEGKSYTRRTAKQNRGWPKKHVLVD